MEREYKTERKIQEQSGSYFVILPKMWVESMGLKQSDPVSITFNGEVRIKALKVEDKVSYIVQMQEPRVQEKPA
jgi:antitoxin component of MazEF toxin-antitoxin module